MRQNQQTPLRADPPRVGHLHQINLDGRVISDFERDALHREISRSQGARQAAATVYYFQNDHIGTPRELTRHRNGEIAWQATYQTWGNTASYAPNPFDWLDPLGLAAAVQLGTYGGLTGEGHKDDKLDAHELLRNKALEQMGCKSGKRMDDNPSIAIGRGQHVNVHRQETALSQQHLRTNGKNEFQFGADGKPTNRQMDVWQGALRKSGMGASQAKRLRKQSNNYLKSLCCCP